MFECEYCETKFLTEKQYGKHKCREQERMMNLETPDGDAAYEYYATWFKKKRLPTKRPTKRTFIGSQFYTPFLSFTEFVNKMGIPDTDMYIELMVDRGVLPQHWYHADIYDVFIDHLDNDCPMSVHTRVSIVALDKIATGFDCELSEVYSKLMLGDFINLIQSMNVSPWILLLSPRFKKFLSTCSSHERLSIEEVINVARWKLVMKQNRTLIPETKAFIDQLDL
jgi:hypothetical protein